MQIAVHQKLEALVKSGPVPPIEALAEVWGNIYAEYSDLTKDPEHTYVLLLEKDIMIDSIICSVENDLQMYQLSFAPLEEKERLCKVIKIKGFRLKPEYESPEDFEKDKQKIMSKLAAIKLRLKSKQEEYSKYLENKSSDTVDEGYFDRWIYRLWKYLGQQVKAKEISVKDFIGLINQYLHDLEVNKKALEPYGKQAGQR